MQRGPEISICMISVGGYAHGGDTQVTSHWNSLPCVGPLFSPSVVLTRLQACWIKVDEPKERGRALAVGFSDAQVVDLESKLRRYPVYQSVVDSRDTGVGRYVCTHRSSSIAPLVSYRWITVLYRRRHGCITVHRIPVVRLPRSKQGYFHTVP